MACTAQVAWHTSIATGARPIARIITQGVIRRSATVRSIARKLDRCARREDPRVQAGIRVAVPADSRRSYGPPAAGRHMNRSMRGGENAMANQHMPAKTDDADARGEHQYGDTETPRPDESPSVTSTYRRPNSYVAGEHGTQQVTTPSSGTGRRGDDQSHD